MTDISTIRRILKDNHRVAVVGLSGKWYRPSHFAAKYLLDHGYEVTPVNPAETEVLGQKSYANLSDLPGPVDVVDIFRRPEEVPALVDQAIEIGARVVWMQIGVVHEEAAAKARAAGLDVIMDRCMKIEYARLFGGLGFVGVNTGVISAKRSRYLPY